jgi:hypothetical protein
MSPVSYLRWYFVIWFEFMDAWNFFEKSLLGSLGRLNRGRQLTQPNEGRESDASFKQLENKFANYNSTLF